MSNRNAASQNQENAAASSEPPVAFEQLEDRRMLSATPHIVPAHARAASGAIVAAFAHDQQESIAFSAAPAAVKTRLQSLAPSGVTIADTQTVFVKTVNSTTTDYSVVLTGTGTSTRIAVDENGAAVAAPTHGTTTLDTLPDAVKAGLQKLAPSGTTLAGTQAVSVHTANGVSTYTVNLAATATTRRARFTVDASGNPTGTEDILFSQAPDAVKSGLQTLAGSTTFADTQTVHVRTQFGATTFSVALTGTGTVTRLTVNVSGAAVNMPGRSTTTFDQLPDAVKTGLQNLAPSGVTIATTQQVSVLSEGNGTTLYTVNLESTGVDERISVDQTGAAATVPSGGEGFGGGGFRRGFGRGGRGHGFFGRF